MKKAEFFIFTGKPGAYLELAPGKANLNVLEMARKDLKYELSASLRKAIRENNPVIRKNLQVRAADKVRIINLKIKPIMESESTEKMLIVVFEETGSHIKAVKFKEGEVTREADRRIKELEKEVMISKEQLQTTIEELETSNEELKATNEELLSANEEMQSTNEELASSREELQSLNEELVTVNTELEEKIRRQGDLNNSLSNLIKSTEIATIFLDKNLCIRLFTNQAAKIIKLIETDKGRPLQDLASNLKGIDLVENSKNVLITLTTIEKEVEDESGNWYRLQIRPYRTLDNVIDGAIIVLVDITQLKQLEQSAQDARLYAESIVKTVRHPLLVLWTALLT